MNKVLFCTRFCAIKYLFLIRYTKLRKEDEDEGCHLRNSQTEVTMGWTHSTHEYLWVDKTTTRKEMTDK